MNLFQTNYSLDELNNQLIDFGLHPKDWDLLKVKNKQIKIQHRQESTFYFIGSVENKKGKAYWKNIHLAGL